MKPMYFVTVIVSCLVAFAAHAEVLEPVHDAYFTVVTTTTTTHEFDLSKQNWTFQCPPDYTFATRYEWSDDNAKQAEPEWYTTSIGIISAQFVRMSRGLLVLKIRSIKVGEAYLVVNVGEHEMWIRVVVVNDEPNV